MTSNILPPAASLPPSAPRRIEHAAPHPAWWRVHTDQIVSDCAAIQQGQVEIIATTPGGFPVIAVSYGPVTPHRAVNWPSATGSPHPEVYAQNTPEVILIAAGVHAEESEGIVTVSNLIRLLETGVDHRGVARPRLVALARKYRLVLLPCVNMDGRRVAPECLNGCTPADYAPISTILKDGSLLRYPALKEHFPMPMDDISQLGTYYNADGYNIMHDCAPGNFRTAEAAGILRLAERERADFFLNLHSGHNIPDLLDASALCYPGNRRTLHAIRREWYANMGMDFVEPGIDKQTDLNNAVTMCTGAATATFEFAALKPEPFENKLECGYILLETLFDYGLRHKLCDRSAILKA